VHLYTGVSSVSRAWSANLDSLTGGMIARAFHEAMPMNVTGFSSYPDFLSVSLIITVTGRFPGFVASFRLRISFVDLKN